MGLNPEGEHEASLVLGPESMGALVGNDDCDSNTGSFLCLLILGTVPGMEKGVNCPSLRTRELFLPGTTLTHRTIRSQTSTQELQLHLPVRRQSHH